MSASNTNCTKWDAMTETTARIARGTAAGLIGGIIASWVMDQYEKIESRPVNVRRLEQVQEELGISDSQSASQEAESQNGNTATVRAAAVVSRKLFDHPLTAQEKKVAGPAVHFGFGGLVGALYGGLSEVFPLVSIGLGIPYAAIVWLTGDEIAVPALGLDKPPTQVSAESHASQLAMHFVYGLTLDLSRRILRRII
jgi:uncharacterized membrane protein YagU involved in acid resistance